jgi:hypothetical protein
MSTADGIHVGWCKIVTLRLCESTWLATLARQQQMINQILTVTGQSIYQCRASKCDSYIEHLNINILSLLISIDDDVLTGTEKTSVIRAAPMNPSNVFFGDNLQSWVTPNNFPHTYADISLQTTSATGKTYL